MNHLQKTVTALAVLTLTSGLAVAGTMGPIENKQSAYLKLGVGGSSSMQADMNVVTPIWDPSPEGYNHNVGSTALYSAAAGYHFSPLISLDFEYIYRPSFTYAKYQTSLATGVAGFAGTEKIRYFNLQSNSLMANLGLHGQGLSPHLVWDASSCMIQPFVAGGLGVAFNTVSNFHTLTLQPSSFNTSMMPDHSITSLAWQLSAGLEIINWKNFELAAGYRYYNGGTFESNNYIINDTSSDPAWKGTVAANEGFVTISYNIA